MSLLDSFESYTKIRSYAERISISASGGISFNTTVFEKLNLEKYQYASFFYNRNNGYVGVRFTNQETSDSYRLNPRKNTDGRWALYLSIKGFVMSYKVVPSGKVRKYKLEKFEKNENILEVVLSPLDLEVEEKFCE